MRRDLHFFGPALRAPSFWMAIFCVLGRRMVVRERIVHLIPNDPVASGTYTSMVGRIIA